jgi:hypothetical protein
MADEAEQLQDERQRGRQEYSRSSLEHMRR